MHIQYFLTMHYYTIVMDYNGMIKLNVILFLHHSVLLDHIITDTCYQMHCILSVVWN